MVKRRKNVVLSNISNIGSTSKAVNYSKGHTHKIKITGFYKLDCDDLLIFTYSLRGSLSKYLGKGPKINKGVTDKMVKNALSVIIYTDENSNLFELKRVLLKLIKNNKRLSMIIKDSEDEVSFNHIGKLDKRKIVRLQSA